MLDYWQISRIVMESIKNIHSTFDNQIRHLTIIINYVLFWHIFLATIWFINSSYINLKVSKNIKHWRPKNIITLQLDELNVCIAFIYRHIYLLLMLLDRMPNLASPLAKSENTKNYLVIIRTFSRNHSLLSNQIAHI